MSPQTLYGPGSFPQKTKAWMNYSNIKREMALRETEHTTPTSSLHGFESFCYRKPKMTHDQYTHFGINVSQTQRKHGKLQTKKNIYIYIN